MLRTVYLFSSRRSVLTHLSPTFRSSPELSNGPSPIALPPFAPNRTLNHNVSNHTPHRRITRSARNRARIKANKRRSRAAKQSYIATLEAERAHHRAASVQASVEVQAAARRVARENGRLRMLLERVGVAGSVVEAWVRGDEGAIGEGQVRLCRGSSSESRTSVCTAVTTPDIAPKTPVSAPPPPSPPSSPPPPAICQLLTHLRLDPSLDIHHLRPSIDPSSAQSPSTCSPPPAHASPNTPAGVPCASAYDLLIPHATTSNRLARIATILEGGCVKDASGGCSVRAGDVMGALDEFC
ncbi:hypothetical protein EDC01DRAFT_479872 [Geopyxis carbonaria]|nr:hypothetical protein EDC01DRAFT_479872 [Geopyxis carbonaria]